VKTNARWSVVGIITVRRYAKCGICRGHVSVCLSHSGIVSKRLNLGSHKYCHTIARESSFLVPMLMAKFDGHLLKTNRMSYVLYQMAMFLMTLGDP